MKRLHLAALGVLVGCAPGLSMRGTVREVPPGCRAEGEVSAEGEPLDGARVAIRCRDRTRPILQVVTDAQGRFSARRDGLVDHGCWVTVEKPGYTATTYPVSHLCAVEGDVLEGCHAVSLQAELHRVICSGLAGPCDAP